MISRELEREGITTAHVCTMINVSKDIGGNRIVPSRSVLFPTGDPELTPEGEKEIRQKIINVALKSIRTEIDGPLVFD